MNVNRKTAIIVGILFIIALVLDIIGRGIYEPILNASDFLVIAYPIKVQLIIGILLEFICAPAIVLIPILLFPILKKYNESIALGYVGFRFLEGILFIFMVINSLSLISLSQEYLNSRTGDASYFQTLGNSIQAKNDWATLIYIIVFTLGALMFYHLLYQSKIIPRFISVWGFIAAALLLTGALLGMLDLIPLSKVMIFFGPPIALNEITLAVWLIARGFNSSAIASESAKTDIN
jgi:hypothetical protein